MNKMLRNSRYRSKLILEELETRQLFSDGAAAVAPPPPANDAAATVINVDANIEPVVESQNTSDAPAVANANNASDQTNPDENPSPVTAVISGAAINESNEISVAQSDANLPQSLTIPNETTSPEIEVCPSVDSSLTETRNELIIVDSRVNDYQQLIDDIVSQAGDGRNFQVVLLDGNKDGIAQITETLSHYQNLDAVHLISHGSDGNIDLGTDQLNFQTLVQNQAQIKSWGDAFAANGDFLIYGCNVAETQFGQSFVDYLSGLTGADVAASTDATGSASLGADWQLEYQSGIVETQNAISVNTQNLWTEVLAVTSNGTVTSAANSNTTSLTWSHTVNVGSDRALFVEIAIDNLGSNVNGVTYGGVALTQVGRTEGNHAVEIWALVNPTVGTANVVVSLSGNTAVAAGASTFNGVNQSTPYGTYAGNSGTTIPLINTTGSVTVASATGDVVIDAQFWTDTLADTTGSGQTSQWSSSSLLTSALGSSSTEAGAASVTMSGSASILSVLGAQWSIGAVSIKAAAVVANTAPFAYADNVTGNEDTTITGNVLSNDTDAENNTLTAMLVSSPSNSSSFTLNSDGSFSYTPSANWSGIDSFQYLVDDGSIGRTHYWGLEGNATDSVGASNGALVNGPTTVAGLYGDALQFDGVNDYVALPDVTYTNEFSLSFNFKVDDNSGTGLQYFYSHGAAPSLGLSNTVQVALSEASYSGGGASPNQLVTTVWDSNDTSGQSYIDVSSLIGDGQWHQYALTVTAGLGTQVYVDGVLKGSVATGGGTIDPTGSAYLGARSDLDPTRFLNANGKIDTMALYNRALSSGEVASLAANAPQATATFTVAAVNDAPTATNLSAPGTYTEDTALNLTDMVISDVDSANVTVTLTLSNVAAGSLNTATSGTVTSTYNAGTGVWTASGAIADVNTLLVGLTFTPTANFNGNFTIATSVSDGVAAAVTGTKSMTGIAVNDAPTITSNGGGSTATASIAENSTAVTTVTATDIDGATTFTYSISGGVDASKFAINSATGALSFLTAPNFELPTDTGSNNVYDVTVQVSDGSLTDTQDISVTINNLDEVAPTVTSGAFAAAVNENSGAGQVVYTASSTDTGDIATGSTSYSLGGADAALFGIDANTGAVTLTGNPNFEAKASYSVTVTATDAAGNASAAQAVTLAVNNLDEVSTGQITISGVVSLGQTLTVNDTLQDPDGINNTTYIWLADGIAVGVGKTYTLAGSDAGKEITVIANYTDGNGVIEFVASTSKLVMRDVNPSILPNNGTDIPSLAS
ncbi:DUF4347 domain-containing protein, partial [Methyloglobulus morosus]|uniref:DUF4347 domain-containing protein n=1 Tax=Methyloglobulus morosus TaxID=1410681 RepID=UPI000565353E